jgi:hypothetical protein
MLRWADQARRIADEWRLRNSPNLTRFSFVAAGRAAPDLLLIAGPGAESRQLTALMDSLGQLGGAAVVIRSRAISAGDLHVVVSSRSANTSPVAFDVVLGPLAAAPTSVTSASARELWLASMSLEHLQQVLARLPSGLTPNTLVDDGEFFRPFVIPAAGFAASGTGEVVLVGPRFGKAPSHVLALVSSDLIPSAVHPLIALLTVVAVRDNILQLGERFLARPGAVDFRDGTLFPILAEFVDLPQQAVLAGSIRGRGTMSTAVAHLDEATPIAVQPDPALWRRPNRPASQGAGLAFAVASLSEADHLGRCYLRFRPTKNVTRQAGDTGEFYTGARVALVTSVRSGVGVGSAWTLVLGRVVSMSPRIWELALDQVAPGADQLVFVVQCLREGF